MDEKNIGTLARFMGVSPHTIKYYEKIGILSSDRDEKSNYRRFELRVCTDLAECIKYRSMGFSLKELDILRKTADGPRLQEMLGERIGSLEEEVERLSKLCRFLKKYETECRRAEEELGEWYIEPFDRAVYCRMQTKNLAFTGENLSSDPINIMDFAPETMAVAVLHRNYLEGGEQEFSWGQSLSFPQRQPLFDQMDRFICLAPKKVFVTYRRYTGAFIAGGEMAEDIRKAFHEFAPVFPDHAYAFRIKITHDEAGNDWNYFKVIVPLK